MDFIDLLSTALQKRSTLLIEPHDQAIRLFNGFYEGFPDLVADVYARTLLLYDYADPVQIGKGFLSTAQIFYLQQLPWITCVIQKVRQSTDSEQRRGQVIWGGPPARKIREAGVVYALDLSMNQDASFYLDTRNLRTWIRDHSTDQRVLNTFAYTGSLGVAAWAGGASRVVQTDLNRRFLNLAKDSCSLNGYPIQKADYLTGDFFRITGGLRRHGEQFDLVIADPPFFSSTTGGRVEMAAESERFLNKLRPLVADNGRLVAVNNAIFLSGADYLTVLERLGLDGYLSVEEIIPVPEDIIGYLPDQPIQPPVDPAPFNHPTKIAILRVRRKA